MIRKKFNYCVIISLLFIVACNSNSESVLMKGDKAPNFSAKNQNGNVWNAADYYGEYNLIVYFYPAAMTAGCTQQACSYRDSSNKLKNHDAKIVGVSGDEVENLKIFQKENNLNFTLLSDPDGEIAQKFGVPTYEGGQIMKEVEGQQLELTRGATHKRWTFLIDKSGVIAYRDTSVNVTQDSQNILEVLQKIEE